MKIEKLVHQLFTLAVASLLGVGPLGCSADAPVEPAAAADEQELATSTRFECKTSPSADADLVLSVGASGTRASATLGLENQITAWGALDAAYRPRTANRNFVRFSGFPALNEADADLSLLVEKSILLRQPGRVKMQQRGSDFVETIYDCKLQGSP